MFKKLGEFRNDVTDGISSVAQRSVQSFQEFINAPYTAIELPQKEADYFDKVLSGSGDKKCCVIEKCYQSRLMKSEKWIDAILENPKPVDGRRQIFRFYRLPINKEIEAVQNFFPFSLIFNDLNIPALYSQSVIQFVLNSLKKEPNWTSAHVAVDISLKSAFTVHSLTSKRLSETNGDSLGRSPLQLAVSQSKRDIFEHLLAVGAKTDSQDLKGNTIYHYFLEIGEEGFGYLNFIVNQAHHKQADPAMDKPNSGGDTPLHVCAREGKDKFFYAFIDAGASISVDSQNGRVINLVLQFILTDEKRRYDWIEKVIETEKEEVNVRETKFGSRPMHWARTKADVDQLMKHGAHINACPSDSLDSPLHIMIQKNRTEAAYCLILHGARVNDSGKDGNTPLHYAIILGNIKLVKALLLFGADYNQKNDFEKTPGLLAIENRHINGDTILILMQEIGSMVLGESNLPQKTVRFSELKDREMKEDLENENPVELTISPTVSAGVSSKISRSKSHQFESKDKPALNRDRAKSMDHIDEMKSSDKRRKKLRILCLDGGGIRGLVLTQLLMAIEQEAGKPIHELFDYITGTSTGGMAALGFLLKYKPSDIQRFYLRLKDDCFNGKRPYNEAPLENCLKELFGEKRLLDFNEPRVFVTSVLADRQPADLFLFRSYVPSGKGDEYSNKSTDGAATFKPTLEYQNELIWKAARCTGAAPTYFPAMGRFLDGGLASNNPTLDAIVEVNREITASNKFLVNDEEAESIHVIVSIGTGNQPVKESRATDSIWPTNALEAYKSITATVELAKMFVDTTCEADRWVISRARSWCEMTGINYYRLNPQLATEVQLDETDNEKLFQLMWETRKYINQEKEYIKDLVRQIL